MEIVDQDLRNIRPFCAGVQADIKPKILQFGGEFQDDAVLLQRITAGYRQFAVLAMLQQECDYAIQLTKRTAVRGVVLAVVAARAITVTAL